MGNFFHCFEPLVWISEEGNHQCVVLISGGILKLEPVLVSSEFPDNLYFITKAILEVTEDKLVKLIRRPVNEGIKIFMTILTRKSNLCRCGVLQSS